MKIFFSREEVLQMVLSALDGPSAQNMLPESMRGGDLNARFEFDSQHQEMTGGIEVFLEEDVDDAEQK